MPVMSHAFDHFAARASAAMGHPVAFLCAVVFIVAWAITGPFFRFSETWQLVINTGTTIVTFLLVFLIQNTQNRNENAMQKKLDELIRVNDRASNTLRGIEREGLDDNPP